MEVTVSGLVDEPDTFNGDGSTARGIDGCSESLSCRDPLFSADSLFSGDSLLVGGASLFKGDPLFGGDSPVEDLLSIMPSRL
jgi:hypothetical protein